MIFRSLAELAKWCAESAEGISSPDANTGQDAIDRSMLRDVSMLFAMSVQRSFVTATSPSGVPWAPRKQHYKHRPLIKTARMLNEVLTQVKSPMLTRTTSAGKVVTRLLFNIDHPEYAKYHQYGTSRMPARPFLGISDDVTDRLENRAATDVLTFVVR